MTWIRMVNHEAEAIVLRKGFKGLVAATLFTLALAGCKLPGPLSNLPIPGVGGDEAAAAETQQVYRLYNPVSGEHFYTVNAVERDNLVAAGWADEGIGWIAPVSSDFPVYRLSNPNSGEHHFTMDAAERDTLVAAGWVDEGIGWYSDPSQAVPLLREFNPSALTGSHNYTTDPEEHNQLVAAGWVDEGVGWYAVSAQ